MGPIYKYPTCEENLRLPSPLAIRLALYGQAPARLDKPLARLRALASPSLRSVEQSRSGLAKYGCGSAAGSRKRHPPLLVPRSDNKSRSFRCRSSRVWCGTHTSFTSPNPSSPRRPSARSTPYTYLRITACRLPGSSHSNTITPGQVRSGDLSLNSNGVRQGQTSRTKDGVDALKGRSLSRSPVGPLQDC